jgi:hypothetical protein
MDDMLHDIDEAERDARRLRALWIGHLALFTLLLVLTAAALGRAQAEDPGTVVMRLQWTVGAQP